MDYALHMQASHALRRAFLLVAASLAAPSWAQQSPAGPLVRENATVKLTDHVWAIPDFNIGMVPNVGIVVGSRATLVVDTGLGPRNGETIVREMKKVSTNAEVYVATRTTIRSTRSARRRSRGRSC